MDLQRAKAILESPEEIDVVYHGTPVWLETINDGSTVAVSFLDSRERTEVPVEDLEER